MDSNILFFNGMTILTTEQRIKHIHNISSLGYVSPVLNKKICQELALNRQFLVLGNFKTGNIS